MKEGETMTNDQIQAMVQRFLAYPLPADFMPDGGISFEREYNVTFNAVHGLPPSVREPVGTNLLTAAQAEAMIRHLVADL